MTPPAPPNWLGLLSDEERVPHGAASAVDRATTLLEPPAPDPETLFVAANLLALVHFRLGRLDDARAICRAEIAYARTHPTGAARAQVTALALQPQVNLLRIEGYAGDLGRAMVGLAALEEISAGRAVRTEELDWSPDDLADDPALARRVRALARNIRVSDTCKILLRRGLYELLLSEAARFQARWPMMADRGLQHAAEAPWAARPEDQRTPAADELRNESVQVRRLAFVRTLHLAAHSAQTGRTTYAAELTMLLDAHLSPLAEGSWASTLTVPRWRAVLGATLLLVGEETRGRTLMLDALDAGRRAGDTALVSGLLRRLAPPGDAAGAAEPLGERVELRLAAATARISAELATRPVRAGV